MPKKLASGDMLYKINEIVPEEIEGYKREGNLFRLVYLPCVYREDKKIRLICGKIRMYEYCRIKDTLVSKLYCSQCKERKESD